MENFKTFAFRFLNHTQFPVSPFVPPIYGTVPHPHSVPLSHIANFSQVLYKTLELALPLRAFSNIVSVRLNPINLSDVSDRFEDIRYLHQGDSLLHSGPTHHRSDPRTMLRVATTSG